MNARLSLSILGWTLAAVSLSAELADDERQAVKRQAVSLYAAERAERKAAEREMLDWWDGQAARARSRSASAS